MSETARDRHGQSTEHKHGDHQHDAHRTHKFNPANVERLLGEERRRLLEPQEVLSAARISLAQTVVDLGCGPGYFSLPAARIVGEGGRVYAVDVQPEMVDLCRARAAEAGLHQLETVQSTEGEVPLAGGIADRVFVAFVLHEADDQQAFLCEAARLLKPGGEIAVVEWHKKDGSPGPPAGLRISPDDVKAIAEHAGLRPLGSRDLNEHHYMVRLAPQ
jgi:SAM-dependent methyltransferase